MSDASNSKSIGTPFAGASSKPWLVRPPTGLLALIAQTVTVLFRHHFGERYLKPSTLAKGMACLALYLIGMRMYAAGSSGNPDASVPVASWLAWFGFATAFLFFASVHMFAAVRRRVMFRDEYSYSGGRLWPFWMKLPLVADEWDFERFYEPAIIIAAGVALLFWKNWFGVYLVLAGASAFLVARSKYRTRRDLELDTLDTRTEASNLPRFENVQPAARITQSARTTPVPQNTEAADTDDPFKRLKANNPELARQMEADRAREEGRT